MFPTSYWLYVFVYIPPGIENVWLIDSYRILVLKWPNMEHIEQEMMLGDNQIIKQCPTYF